MSVAIIIGFQYTKNDLLCYNNAIPRDKYYLPAIRLDIINAYNYCKKKNYNKIIVVTDITCDYKRNTEEGNLIKNLTKNNEYYLYKNKEDLINLLKIHKKYQRILFYFTGHGKPNKFIFPDGLVMQDEFNFLLESEDEIVRDILMILDCCNGTSPLPYTFVTTDNFVYYRFNGSQFKTTDRVLCMTSCTDNQVSMTTHNGSLFTISLFNLLDKETSIETIYKKVMEYCSIYYEQKMMIYSNDPLRFYL